MSKTHAPQTCASASSATLAFVMTIATTSYIIHVYKHLSMLFGVLKKKHPFFEYIFKKAVLLNPNHHFATIFFVNQFLSMVKFRYRHNNLITDIKAFIILIRRICTKSIYLFLPIAEKASFVFSRNKISATDSYQMASSCPVKGGYSIFLRKTVGFSCFASYLLFTAV